MRYLIAFCLSVLLGPWLQPLLPLSALLISAAILVLVCLFIAVSSCFYRLLKPLLLLLAFFFGCCVFHYSVSQQLAQALPQDYWKKDIWVEGRIDSLAKASVHSEQFRFFIESVDDEALAHLTGQQVDIKNYNTFLHFKPCQQWRLQLRLKPTRGLANGLSFDYQRHLFSQGILSRGYIRQSMLLDDSDKLCINAWRYQWRRYLLSAFSQEDAAWLAAISIGDKSLFNQGQRQLLQQLGIFHLFVISGLHIGLVAAVVYALVLCLRRCGGGLLYRGDWRLAARVIAFSMALFYGLLAGGQLPVQRALVTLFIFMFSSQLGLRWSLWQRFLLALSVILLWQPLAPLNSGFCLSFAAVFFLLLINQYHLQWPSQAGLWQQLKQLFVLQCLMSLALMPLLMLLFGQWSALMIIANCLLIPLMSIAIIPMVLVAVLCWLLPFMPIGLSELLLFLLQQMFSAVLPLLSLGQSLFTPALVQMAWPLSHFIAASLGLLLMLGPALMHGRQLGCVLFIASCLPLASSWPSDVLLKAQFLDVGQGLSVLIQTPQHSLLFDTGAGWEQGSMVDWVHRPLFQQQGITQLDKLVISHSDNDHSGGLADLQALLPIRTIESSGQLVQSPAIKPCQAGQAWHWDSVEFSYLHPDAAQYKKTNNQSCVLLIKVAQRSILLTGDIEAKVEALLLGHQRLQQIDVLQVPHHGSKTSSTDAFLAATQPQISIVSAGFLNRFKHPHDAVAYRYQQQGSQLLNTAIDGKVTVYFYRNGQIALSSTRAKARFFDS